jgi:ribosomal protein S12 methylthiotransferase
MAKKINIITLGCSKNRVDSEVLMKQLAENGFVVTHESEEGGFDYVVINTCGFIGDAKEESIDTILQFCDAREEGLIEKVVVFGCLSERYGNELSDEIPEVDAWFGKFDLIKMLEFFGAKHMKTDSPWRILTTPPHYAFVKISEGCNRTCSFCAIPKMTGKHKSRPMEVIVEEVSGLIAQGTREIILIAQDLSFYGLDIYKKTMLAELMDKLALLPGLKWLRIHYTYPAGFPLEILDVMAKHDNICNYLDIALQHVSDNMLSKMRRNISKEETYTLLRTIREKVPGIHLRTTLLVGHPGETKKDFEELKQFVSDIRFERLGIFPYSHEEDTYAWDNYEDNIADDVKDKRAEEIMKIQEAISYQHNEGKIGQEFDVVIDGIEGEYTIGRTMFDSPEVDNEVLIESVLPLEKGSYHKVRIIDADEYDVYGEIVK